MKFLSSMAETEFREQGTRLLLTTANQEKRPTLDTTVREWRTGRGGHVTEDITKNLTRKIGHGYCKTAG
jgi:hypothetical protein